MYPSNTSLFHRFHPCSLSRFPSPTYRCLVRARQIPPPSATSSFHRRTLTNKPIRRMSQLDIQMLARPLYDAIFPSSSSSSSSSSSTTTSTPEIIELAKEHLKKQDVWGKPTESVPDTHFPLPPLLGPSIQEHFYRLGQEQAEPFLSEAQDFIDHPLPPLPSSTHPEGTQVWMRQAGWTRYTPNSPPTPIPYPPLGETVVFDVETLPGHSDFPVIAIAASSSAWYCWISPWLLGHSPFPHHLIPFGPDPLSSASSSSSSSSSPIHDAETPPRLIIGHHVSYDRSRILDEYRLQSSSNRFLDTMSLHIAHGGLCTHQRPLWTKMDKAHAEDDVDYITRHKESSRFYDVSSTNSLAHLHRFYCKGPPLSKDARDIFIKGGPQDVLGQFGLLVDYCARDVLATKEVFDQVYPRFRKKCPHPISLAGILHMGKGYLPVNESWPRYLQQAEKAFQDMSHGVEVKLRELAEAARHTSDPQSDPWLRHLDWTVQPLRMTKAKYKKDGTYAKGGEPRPVARQRLPGYPQWYKDCHNPAEDKIKITTRTRIAPYLLKLKWRGYPVYYSRVHGWTFRVPEADWFDFCKSSNLDTATTGKEGLNSPSSSKGNHLDQANPPSPPPITPLSFPTDPSDPDYEPSVAEDYEGYYCRIPHKDGDEAKCGNPLAKGYVSAAEDGTLSSEYPLAREALAMNASCSYWISARDRVQRQMVVWSDESDQGSFSLGLSSRSGSKEVMGREGKEEEGREGLQGERHQGGNSAYVSSPSLGEKGGPSRQGVILPQIQTMGTVTRRAVEPCWMTASNAKKTRIGSELKAMIRAPKGYRIVGADVDSEELWISSLVGDAQFGEHGSTAFGWMTLQGSKAAGTDLHSRTARILGINRDHAKIFNYGRIYGAGIKFATQLLAQFNPEAASAPEKAKTLAKNLYAATKGRKEHRTSRYGRSFWHGGSESYMFNALEAIALQDRPVTPALGCEVSEALRPKYVGSQYMTSRVNWVVQSSGVDYLHLLLVSMSYLCRRYGIQARFMISVHDEIRYLVRQEDQYRAGLALQVSNLWTRAFFSARLGLNDLPQSVAFFSAVDMDHVLRKEVDMECITPSNPKSMSPGECCDIEGLIQKTDGGKLSSDTGLSNPDLEEKIKVIPVPKHILDPAYERPNPKDPHVFAFLHAQSLDKLGRKVTLSPDNPHASSSSRRSKSSLPPRKAQMSRRSAASKGSETSDPSQGNVKSKPNLKSSSRPSSPPKKSNAGWAPYSSQALSPAHASRPIWDSSAGQSSGAGWTPRISCAPIPLRKSLKGRGKAREDINDILARMPPAAYY